ncbi:MAG: DUF1264 domain-containing protein [Candidatus Zixiibacteriota bacterium]|nr:MAG: DUF1264 domain-containing protein [candidate division Zixibacteria bacterium]
MKKSVLLSAVLAGGLVLWRRRSRNSHPPALPPGDPRTPGTQALNLGAALLQSHAPVRAFNTYLDGFHFYADDMGRQVEAHHYCSRLSEDFTQCVIFNGNTPEALLIGVEYIISERLFLALPEEEKKLWHSHRYEVKSGQLIAPGVPEPAERELMTRIVSTYGKVWHTWDASRDELPLGLPALMMAFTADGQLDAERLSERNHRFGVSAMRRRRQRDSILEPEAIPGADAWQSGRTWQVNLEEREMTTPSTRPERRPEEVME